MESRFGERAGPVQGESPNPLAVISTGIGVVLVLIGVYLSLQIFFTVVGAVRDPARLEEMISEWESTAIGDRPFVEMPARFEFNLAEGEEMPPQVLSAEGPIEVHANRFMAVSTLIGLGFLLAFIAMGLLGGGVKLLSMSLSRGQMRQLALEIQRAQEKEEGKESG